MGFNLAKVAFEDGLRPCKSEEDQAARTAYAMRTPKKGKAADIPHNSCQFPHRIRGVIWKLILYSSHFDDNFADANGMSKCQCEPPIEQHTFLRTSRHQLVAKSLQDFDLLLLVCQGPLLQCKGLSLPIPKSQSTSEGSWFVGFHCMCAAHWKKQVEQNKKLRCEGCTYAMPMKPREENRSAAKPAKSMI